MAREFAYKGEMWRVTAHGIRGHEEVFIVHLDKDGREGSEASIDRMTEPNDASAPLQDIIVMLCERLIEDRGITVRDPGEPFAWRQGDGRRDVHNGVRVIRS